MEMVLHNACSSSVFLQKAADTTSPNQSHALISLTRLLEPSEFLTAKNLMEKSQNHQFWGLEQGAGKWVLENQPLLSE